MIFMEIIFNILITEKRYFSDVIDLIEVVFITVSDKVHARGQLVYNIIYIINYNI